MTWRWFPDRPVGRETTIRIWAQGIWLSAANRTFPGQTRWAYLDTYR